MTAAQDEDEQEVVLISEADAARRLGVSKRTVQRLRNARELRGLLLKSRRLYPVAELDAYVERLAAASSNAAP